jgi:hypothetical protein
MSAVDATAGRDTEGCGGHAQLSDELRALVELLAGRWQPWLERVAQRTAAPGETAQSCRWCPVCAVIAALRGDQPEVLGRLAEHAAGLLGAARELLTPPAGHPADGVRAAQPGPRRTVQHIEVRPVARDADGAVGC